MSIKARIETAIKIGDQYSRYADLAAARGEHHTSMEWNKKAVVSYTIAETLSIEMLEEGWFK
jgi:hypothetical protein